MKAPERRVTRLKRHYGDVATIVPSQQVCCSPDYSDEELASVPRGAFLGEGSGNPIRAAKPQAGEVVVDLGSGAGIDVFLAASRVGPEGQAIGIDMTPEMLERARKVARREGITNVEFRQSYIEELPLDDAIADVVVSNCVINLSDDKAKVFREAYRVLKPGGRLVVSDIVKERPLDMVADCGCVTNAMLRDDYFQVIQDAGFVRLEVLEDGPYLRRGSQVDASAVTLKAFRPDGEV